MAILQLEGLPVAIVDTTAHPISSLIPEMVNALQAVRMGSSLKQTIEHVCKPVPTISSWTLFTTNVLLHVLLPIGCMPTCTTELALLNAILLLLHLQMI